jgi:hypothetical protein
MWTSPDRFSFDACRGVADIARAAAWLVCMSGEGEPINAFTCDAIELDA